MFLSHHTPLVLLLEDYNYVEFKELLVHATKVVKAVIQSSDRFLRIKPSSSSKKSERETKSKIASRSRIHMIEEA